ncbi:MAG: hypothetical protein CL912_28690 [Deltaproteobacteria bacterium]|nr:hypothetical protein [Deltaproteobacteria bacterium]
MEHAVSEHDSLGIYLQLAQGKHIHPLHGDDSSANGGITNATCPMISQPEFQIPCIKSGASDLTNLAIQHWQVVVGGSFIYSVQ